MPFNDAVEAIGRVVESVGIGVIVIGAAIATVRFLSRIGGHAPGQPAYRAYRRAVGQSLLLGLEFLIAGDIIRTVVIEPTFRTVGILAIIIAIRTFLSLELELEIEGRWPWQRGERPGTRDDDGTAH